MADDFLQVNEHYLDRVMDLASVKDVEASEDIYAANGMKLVAKGSRLSSTLQERLIVHKLRKPLEACLRVADGVDSDFIHNAAEALLDEMPDLHPLIGQITGRESPLHLLDSAELNQALSLLLTLADRAGQRTMTHYLLVSLLTYGLAKQIGFSGSALADVTTAGLLHDVGELYINPDYLHNQHALHPTEWRHVVVHPIIAQKLLSETTPLPAAVATAVLEHHERYNGFGYPRQLSGAQFSKGGQVIAMAEMIAGVFMRREQPLARAELAVKIVPGEHAPDLVAAISNAWLLDRQLNKNAHENPAAIASMQSVGHRLGQAQGWVAHALEIRHTLPRAEEDLLALLSQRLNLIQRVYASTGLDLVESQNLLRALDEPPLRFEMQLIANEILWRLRDLGRDLAVRIALLPENHLERYLALIELLNGDRPARAHVPDAESETDKAA